MCVGGLCGGGARGGWLAVAASPTAVGPAQSGVSYSMTRSADPSISGDGFIGHLLLGCRRPWASCGLAA